MLELSTLDVRKAGLDAPYGFRLLPFDQLGELALAPANALVELVEGASAFGGVGLELGASRRDGLLRRAREIITQTYEPCALLLALGFEAFRVSRDSGLGLGDQLFLLLRKLSQLVDDAALGPLQIVRPGRQTSVHLLLGDREGLAELVRGRTRAFRCGRASLLRDPPLLLRQ